MFPNHAMHEVHENPVAREVIGLEWSICSIQVKKLTNDFLRNKTSLDRLS